MGLAATLPLPFGGFPTLQSGGENHKWPTSGPSDYVTPAASGVPNAGRSLSGKKSVPEPVFPKNPACTPCAQPWLVAVGRWRLAAVGCWQLATGGWWQLVVVGGGWWLVIGGWWWLVVVGSWWLVAAGGWRRFVVGSWWRLVVGGWRLVVPWGGP